MEKEFDFKYRENGYFNEGDTYLVQTHNTVHEAKATFEKGFGGLIITGKQQVLSV